MNSDYRAVKRNYQMIRYDQLISPHENGNPGFNKGITGINRKKINDIKRNYDPGQVRAVVVSFRDGKYYIIDGQHTALSIYEMNCGDGGTLIYCDVREGLTYQQEAQLFYDLNTNAQVVSIADKIWSLVCAGNHDAVDFKNIIERCGYTFGRKTTNTVAPIGTCWSIYNKPNGAARLESILTLIHDTWLSNMAAVNTDLIKGIDEFFKNHGSSFDRERFIKTFSVIDPKTIVTDARSLYKSMSDRAYTMPVCTYLMLGRKYNSNLRTNRIQIVMPS